jgi:hypothetical protein
LATSVLALGGVAYGVTKYRNIPGPVTGSYAGGITGTFHLEKSAAGLASQGYGGACLIFRAKDLNRAPGIDLDWMEKKHCKADSDCTRTDIHTYGYCHQSTKQCWTKPQKPTADAADSLVCIRKRPPGPPLQPGKTVSIPVSHADLVKMKVPQNSKVRVLTCLNGIPPGGCGGNGNPSRSEWGTPKQL